MISFLKKFFCKLNTNKTTKEKDNEDYLSFEFLDRESIRDFQNTLLKSLPTVESASKSISLLAECGYKATDSKHND
jgi:hypothetical protein